LNLSREGWGAGKPCSRVIFSAIALFAMAFVAIAVQRWAHAPALAGTGSPRFLPQAQPIGSQMLGEMPLVFEPNQGQSDRRVRFLSRGHGYSIFLTPGEAVLESQHRNPASRSTLTSVVRMSLAGANSSAAISAEDRLPGTSSYFVGNRAADWHTGVPQFSRVRYQEVYPGVDLVYYGKQGKLEYDFQLAPGSDPSQIALKFAGSDSLHLNTGGELEIAVGTDTLEMHAPRVYQNVDGSERTVPARFVLLAENKVGFELGAYDRSRELIIDPVLSYSTFLGGSGSEAFPTVAVDSSFNIYVTGSTTSTDFPTTSGVLQTTLGGTANVFVTKFSPTGAAPLLFSTYLGGNGTDASIGIAVDKGSNVYVAGTTSSSNFPVVAATAYQTAGKNGNNHVFVSKLNSTGTSLVYSTYLSGSGVDTATGMAIDAQGVGLVFVTGTTTSTDFPLSTLTPPFQSTSLAAAQFFVSKVDTTAVGLASLDYSTYFGGGNPSTGTATGGGIAVDTSGNIYITGGTNFLHTGGSNDFPILNAYQACLDVSPPIPPPVPPPACPTNVTTLDAFVAKINPTGAQGSQLIYSTYLGGSGDDIGYGVAVDTAGNAYVTGSTGSSDIVAPTTITPFQSAYSGNTDAFLGKIGSPTVSSPIYPLNYFSFLGGASGADIGLAIAVDPSQEAHMTGSTASTDFNVINPVQSTLAGGTDAFAAVLATTTSSVVGTQGVYSTYLGGSGNDRGTGIAVDPNGVSYLAGETASANFPVVTPFQASINGTQDAFLSKLTPLSGVTISGTVSPSPVGVGNPANFVYSIVNNGPDTASTISFSDTLPATDATFTSITASPGSCITTPVNGVVTCTLGPLAVGSTATVTLVLTPSVATSLSNTGCITVNGGSQLCSNPSPSVPVTDFSIATAPASATVTAGQPASFTITLTPLPTYPSSISLSCSSGLPTGSTCSFTTTPVTIPSTSAVTTTMVVNTTARVTTTTEWMRKAGPIYATFIPLFGLVVFGLSGSRRRRRTGTILLLFIACGLTMLLPACSSSKSTTTTTGTPAGTYIITVSGASGGASHPSVITLVVQ
jgi:uncharacterized repeat protein (TIGR01451 family)